MKRKMLISISILLFIISICFIYYKEYNINNNIVAMNGKIDTSNMISIMLEQSDGTYSKSTSNTWPDSSTYTFDSTKSSCENGGELSWDSTNNMVILNSTSSDKCYAYFSLGTKTQKHVEFNYTGGEQTFTVPENGEYTLMVFGAAGGSYNDTYHGGYGGYSTGTTALTKGTVLYINVGGKGSCGTNAYVSGGYNGGGDANAVFAASSRTCCSGGGATSIALRSGLLSTLEDYKDDILIVAGGGGGAVYAADVAYGYGGSGGGAIGGVGSSTNVNAYASYTPLLPTAGTQTSGGLIGDYKGANFVESVFSAGAFGQSISINSSIDGDNYSGGGGGFYGGARCGLCPGSGGSGYIGNSKLKNKHMIMYYTGNEEQSYEYSTVTYTNRCVEDHWYCACSTRDNGFARIDYYTYD